MDAADKRPDRPAWRRLYAYSDRQTWRHNDPIPKLSTEELKEMHDSFYMPAEQSCDMTVFADISNVTDPDDTNADNPETYPLKRRKRLKSLTPL